MDEELVQLPWEYAAPSGRLLLAISDGNVAGCVALRPLHQDSCEMRRLHVRSNFRSAGFGRRLVSELIANAREAGYRRMRLNTLPSMTHALALYQSFHFRETVPYVEQPSDGVIYMSLEL